MSEFCSCILFSSLFSLSLSLKQIAMSREGFVSRRGDGDGDVIRAGLRLSTTTICSDSKWWRGALHTAKKQPLCLWGAPGHVYKGVGRGRRPRRARQGGSPTRIGSPSWIPPFGVPPRPAASSPPPLYTGTGGTPKVHELFLSHVQCPSPQFTTSVILL